MGATDDQIAHFMSMLGLCCESARVAKLPVCVVLDDGSEVQGVPSEPTEARNPDEEFDHSGTREWLELGDIVVMTARVRRYSVTLPY